MIETVEALHADSSTRRAGARSVSALHERDVGTGAECSDYRHRARGERGRPPEQGRRAGLQRTEPGPASGQARPPVHRPARIRRGALRGQRPLHRARRAVRPLPLQPAWLGQQLLDDRTPAGRAEGPADRAPSRARRDAHVRADGRPLDLDHRLRPEFHADAALHARIRRQRAERYLSGRGRGLRGAAVLRARFRPLRRQHQLRQHALVLGADHRQPGVRRRRNLQPELHRTRQLRLHPDQRRAHRTAQPAAERSHLVHAEQATLC